jgi:hypothetical protein
MEGESGMNQISHCPGSGIRRPISVDEEARRRSRCPRCGRLLNIRPTRNGSRQGDVAGQPIATLPNHNRHPKGAH